jgi:hypothetical protein
MRRFYLSALCASIFASTTALYSQKEDEISEVVYSRDGFLNHAKHLRFEFDIINGGYQGNHFSYGLGGRFLAYHILGRLSAEIAYTQRMAATFLEVKEMGFSQKTNVDPFKGKELNASLGYSILKKEINSKEILSLRKKPSIVTYSEFPVKIHKTFDLKFGLLSYDFPRQIEIKPITPGITPTIHLMENTRACTFGFSKKRMKKDSYSTEQFGKIKQSAYSEFYMDLIYSLGASFPEALYVAETVNGVIVYNEKYIPLDPDIYKSIKTSMEYNPFGGQIGFRSGSMEHGFGFNTYFAFRPGFISQSDLGIFENLTANITISYHIPLLVK